MTVFFVCVCFAFFMFSSLLCFVLVTLPFYKSVCVLLTCVFAFTCISVRVSVFVSPHTHLFVFRYCFVCFVAGSLILLRTSGTYDFVISACPFVVYFCVCFVGMYCASVLFIVLFLSLFIVYLKALSQ